MEMERHLEQPAHEERTIRRNVCPVADDFPLRMHPLDLAVAEVSHELGKIGKSLVVHRVNADDARGQGYGGNDRFCKYRILDTELTTLNVYRVAKQNASREMERN